MKNYKILYNTYQGFSYPKIFQNKLMWFIWKKLCCSKNHHLFDEVLNDNKEHYLYCDACEKIIVYISGVEHVK